MFLKKNCWPVWAFLVALGATACFAVAHAAQGLFPNPTVMAPPAQPTKMPEFEFANLNGGTLKSPEQPGETSA
jgi:hypothetical protein